MKIRATAVLLLVALSLSGCSSAAGKDYTKKIFNPGSGYYAGTTADKVLYGPGTKAVDQAIGNANKVKSPCTDVNAPVTAVPVSPFDTGTSWFFATDPATDPQMTEEVWASSEHTFSFDASDSALSPRRGKIVEHYPDSKLFDTSLSNSPAIIFDRGSGYKATCMMDPTSVDNKLTSGKMLIYRVTYSNLGRFWCCMNKSTPDVEAGSDSPYQLYRPDDSILSNTEVPPKAVIGFAGRTGQIPNSDPKKRFVTIKLEYFFGSPSDLSASGTITGTSGQWKELSFKEFWETGPTDELVQAMLTGSDRFAEDNTLPSVADPESDPDADMPVIQGDH